MKKFRYIRFWILVLFPIQLRIFWRNVLRWFGINNYEMEMDDLRDGMDLFRLEIGHWLASALSDTMFKT